MSLIGAEVQVHADSWKTYFQLTEGPWHRLCEKLEQAKAAGESVEMEEEFRKLTLQIIGEAFLSLPAEECDKVSPPPT